MLMASIESPLVDNKVTSLNKDDDSNHINQCLATLDQLRRGLPVLLSSRKLDQAAFKIRMDHLNAAAGRLQGLAHLRREQNAPSQAYIELGLPALKRLTHDELQLCNAMLDERLTLARRLYQQHKNLASRVNSVLNGPFSEWRGIWLLARFRKVFTNCQDNDMRVGKKLTEQKIYIAKIGSSLKSRFKDHLENNLASLVKIFDHITAIADRVGQIHSSVRREEQIIRDLEARLRMDQPPSPSDLSPPSLQAIDHANQLIKSDQIDPLAYSSKRLTIARSFARGCELNTNSQEDQDQSIGPEPADGTMAMTAPSQLSNPHKSLGKESTLVH